MQSIHNEISAFGITIENLMKVEFYKEWLNPHRNIEHKIGAGILFCRKLYMRFL